jgi:hypothetical protein
MIMRFVLIRVLATALVGAAACSSTKAAPAQPDANDTSAADGEAGLCTDSLANVSATYGAPCPDTYASALAPAFTCRTQPFGPAVRAGQCGGLAAVAYDWTSHWKVCVYDGIDAGTLVGSEAENDTQNFCNRTSFTAIGGQVPDSCQGSLNISPLLAMLDASCPSADATTDGLSSDAPVE